MTDLSPLSEDSCQHVTVDCISTVGGNSLLFLLPLHMLLPVFHADSIVEQSHFHIEETVEAAQILLLLFVQMETHLFFVFYLLHEIVNIGLFLIQIDLIICLVILDIDFFHQFIFVKQSSMEISK